MTKFFLSLLCTTALILSSNSHAQQINQQLTCKAALTHIKNKLPKLKDTYNKNQLGIIHQGVDTYIDYLDEEHIKPGMEAYPGFAEQVNAMQIAMVSAYDERFSQPRLFMDNAVMIDNCYKSYRPTSGGSQVARIEKMIKTIAAVAQEH